MMKRKLTILGVCLVLAIIAVVFFKGEGANKKSGPTRSLLVTQDGKVIILPEPGGATFTVTMSKSNVSTNTPIPSTNLRK